MPGIFGHSSQRWHHVSVRPMATLDRPLQSGAPGRCIFGGCLLIPPTPNARHVDIAAMRWGHATESAFRMLFRIMASRLEARHSHVSNLSTGRPDPLCSRTYFVLEVVYIVGSANPSGCMNGVCKTANAGMTLCLAWSHVQSYRGYISYIFAESYRTTQFSQSLLLAIRRPLPHRSSLCVVPSTSPRCWSTSSRTTRPCRFLRVSSRI